MKKETKHLYCKAVDSLVLSIELFNRPNDVARVHGVLIMMDHSFEMLLKASILQKGGKIKERQATQTIGFESCVRKAFSDGELKFLNEDEVLTLQSLNGLRDAAQHYTLEISEQHLYFQAQSGLTLFRDIVQRVFEIDLKANLPVRVLPLSTTPPTDIHAFFANEISDIKKLLGPNKRKDIEAKEKLRALAIMENAVQGNSTQPTDRELKKTIKILEQGGNFSQLFPGVSTLNFTANGYGPSLDLRISRKEGVPVQVVPEGSPGAHVVALKRVNELDYYNLGRDQIAKKVGLTGPKTSAVIYHLNLKNDGESFKRISVGNVHHERYSQKAIGLIRQAIDETPINDIWEKYKNRGQN
tara:strand:+ start:3207 stop:4274 length:1068 start_codon:yes stop_codon:yes gene_type:complete